MNITMNFGGWKLEVTTDHASASHGQPVLLVDGEIADVQVGYHPDEPEMPTALDVIADIHGIWGGPQTRRELHDLAAELCELVATPNGADLDRVCEEFLRRATESA